MKSLKSVVVGAFAAVVVFGGIQVVSAVTTNKQSTACANKQTGVMRYTTKSCNKKLETTLVFNSQGVPGVAGATGVAGAKGDTGAAGAKGDTGAAGAAGDTGTAGDKGDTGAAGAKGDKGDTGTAGTNGTAGAKGDTGTAGASGTNVNSQIKNICGVDGTTACVVGVQGPGGGIVFMTPATLGNTSGLFYEAAPSTWYQPSGDPTSAWCSNTNTLLGVGSTLSGTGAMDGANKTTVMLGVCTSGAANLADAYTATVNGVAYADWFLPSKGELNQMYVNLHTAQTPLGGFVALLYWSSSEFDVYNAWHQNFNSGNKNGFTKVFSSLAGYVRPVRAF